MTSEQRTRRREPNDIASAPPSSGGELSAAEAARIGLRHVVELTGKKPEGVASLEPAEDGWIVDVEVVEENRIPSSADILAMYQVDLDLAGTLLAYRRTARYSRGHQIDPKAP